MSMHLPYSAQLKQVPPKSSSGISSWRLAMSNVAEYVKTVTYLFKILSPMSLPSLPLLPAFVQAPSIFENDLPSLFSTSVRLARAMNL